MQLGQAEPVCIFNHHQRRFRHINAHFYDGGGHQQLKGTGGKVSHHVGFFGSRHPPVQEPDGKLGKNVFRQFPVQALCILQIQFFTFLHQGADKVSPFADGQVAADKFVEVGPLMSAHRVSLNRLPPRRHGPNQGQIQIAIDRQGQRPGDR